MIDRKWRILAAAAAIIGATVGFAATASADYANGIRTNVVPQVRQWLQDPAVITAVKAQNMKNAGLSQSDIDNLDKQWRSETAAGGGALIGSVLGNDLSGYLGNVKEKGQGIYTEIFVMDSKGLNVGQSDVTSDYWQGDEAKWKETYLKGADAMLIDEVEFDESTQTFQSQLSLPVVDPASNEVIGAVTVGINVDMVQ